MSLLAFFQTRLSVCCLLCTWHALTRWAQKFYKTIMWHETSTSLKSPQYRSVLYLYFSGICCMWVFKQRLIACILEVKELYFCQWIKVVLNCVPLEDKYLYSYKTILPTNALFYWNIKCYNLYLKYLRIWLLHVSIPSDHHQRAYDGTLLKLQSL